MLNQKVFGRKKIGWVVAWAALAISMSFQTKAFAEDPAPAASASPGPVGGKNVRSKLEEPKSAHPVGVRAADPSQNGRVNTSGALSPMNESSMGVGVQFDLSKPKKVVPEKKKKASQSDEASDDSE